MRHDQVRHDEVRPERPGVWASGLTKSHGDVLALDDVDLVATAGSVHGLAGPNGAGKTTLLRILLGLSAPDAGSVEILGHRVPPSSRRTPPATAGCVEMPRFYPHLSARRNLALLTRLDARPASGSALDAVLERVGLGVVRDAKVGGFSLGMRQRLGLASALLREPRLLVLDEPVNGLDPAGMADVRRLVRDLADAGVTVVMSSHHVAELEALCDAVTVLRAGAVVFAGSVADLHERAPAGETWVRTTDDDRTARLAHRSGVTLRRERDGLVVRSATAPLDALLLCLAEHRVVVRELRPLASPLELLYDQLTRVSA